MNASVAKRPVKISPACQPLDGHHQTLDMKWSARRDLSLTWSVPACNDRSGENRHMPGGLGLQSQASRHRWWRTTSRDYRMSLAAERTYLAYPRTGLALTAAGVAVAERSPRPGRCCCAVASDERFQGDSNSSRATA